MDARKRVGSPSSSSSKRELTQQLEIKKPNRTTDATKQVVMRPSMTKRDADRVEEGGKDDDDDVVIIEDDEKVSDDEETNDYDDDADSSGSEVDYFHEDTLNVEECPYLQKDIDICNQALISNPRWTAVFVPLKLCRVVGAEFVDVEMRLPVNTLHVGFRRAWMLDKDDDVILKIGNVSLPSFRNHEYLPTVTVKRSSSPDEAFPIGKQLENVAEKLLTSFYRLPSPDLMDPVEYGSVFQYIYTEMVQRLPSLSEYCIMCDSKIPAPGLMPAVCKADLCVFQYEDFGLNAHFATLSTTPEVLDLQFAFFSAALNCLNAAQRNLLVDPYPVLQSPTNNGQLAFGKSLITNPDKLQDLMSRVEHFPCAKKLCNSAFMGNYRLEKPIDARLVTWLIVSNRSYLIKLPDEYRLEFLGADQQFFVVADSQTKEDAFQRAKAAYGGRSKFVFHGSPIQNWHSILRNGLVVASGTQLARNGTALGHGIYFSPDPRHSYLYSAGRVAETVNRRFIRVCPDEECCNGIDKLSLNAHIVLSICEVVESAEFICNDQLRWVLKNPEHCCVRFLFVYHRSNTSTIGQPNNTISTIPIDALEKMRRIVELYSGNDYAAKVNVTCGPQLMFDDKSRVSFV